MDKLPLYKMFIADDFEGEEEVDFVALVESPAIQRNFLAFAEGVAHYTAESKMKQEEFSTHLTFAVQDEDQRIVSGPLMIADLPIYRKDEEGEYYVMFTGEQIKKIVQRFFKKGYQAKVNIEHGKKAEGVYMFESYIIDRERGVKPPTGFEDIADGSWFGSFKVENEKLWDQVKAGTFKGFSVEGLFRYEKAGMIVQKEEQIMAQIFKILSQVEQD